MTSEDDLPLSKEDQTVFMALSMAYVPRATRDALVISIRDDPRREEIRLDRAGEVYRGLLALSEMKDRGRTAWLAELVESS